METYGFMGLGRTVKLRIFNIIFKFVSIKRARIHVPLEEKVETIEQQQKQQL